MLFVQVDVLDVQCSSCTMYLYKIFACDNIVPTNTSVVNEAHISESASSLEFQACIPSQIVYVKNFIVTQQTSLHDELLVVDSSISNHQLALNSLRQIDQVLRPEGELADLGLGLRSLLSKDLKSSTNLTRKQGQLERYPPVDRCVWSQ